MQSFVVIPIFYGSCLAQYLNTGMTNFSPNLKTAVFWDVTSTLRMKEISSSKAVVLVYKTVEHDILEEHHMHIYHHRNPRSRMQYTYFLVCVRWPY